MVVAIICLIKLISALVLLTPECLILTLMKYLLATFYLVAWCVQLVAQIGEVTILKNSDNDAFSPVDKQVMAEITTAVGNCDKYLYKFSSLNILLHIFFYIGGVI